MLTPNPQIKAMWHYQGTGANLALRIRSSRARDQETGLLGKCSDVNENRDSGMRVGGRAETAGVWPSCMVGICDREGEEGQDTQAMQLKNA
jgi:hypothetical protein